jgi:hypothetical protein
VLIPGASTTVAAARCDASSQETVQRELAAVTTAAALYTDVRAEIRAQGVSINELAQGLTTHVNE